MHAFIKNILLEFFVFQPSSLDGKLAIFLIKTLLNFYRIKYIMMAFWIN